VRAALLVAGTLVTAAGPHAGDTATPRLAVSVAALAQLHADLLVGFLGLLGGLGFVLRAMHVPLVSLHVLGAAAVVVAMSALWARCRIRPDLSLPVPSAPALASAAISAEG
jgi:cytochrome c oxidase assembly protein subunit 15